MSYTIVISATRQPVIFSALAGLIKDVSTKHCVFTVNDIIETINEDYNIIIKEIPFFSEPTYKIIFPCEQDLTLLLLKYQELYTARTASLLDN